MTLAYAIALAEARSCLAALADSTADFDESVHYEHLLLDLDTLHPIGPGLSPTAGTKVELLDRLEGAVDRMIDLGGDGLRLERILISSIQPRLVASPHPVATTLRDPQLSGRLGSPRSRTWCRLRRSTRSGRCRSVLARWLRP